MTDEIANAPGSEEYLRGLSSETLDSFENIATQASNKLKESAGIQFNPLANSQTFTSTGAQDNLSKGSRNLTDGYQQLEREPAIARIIYEDGAGNQNVLYISRGITLNAGTLKMANQRAPIGRLAAQDVGDPKVIDLPGGSQELTLIEKSILRPAKNVEGWDSRDTIYEHEDSGIKTIQSLRALLKELDLEDDFEQFLEGDENTDVVVDGVAHQVRFAMGLRDQPILDKFQDDIYRLSLDSRLFIAGPPGTGKTTTLIKRLGQKLDSEFLSNEEAELIQKAGSKIPYEQDWVMFTPTELLKHYLKEAFSREQVPASDSHIKTWITTRRNLARDVLGLLQSAGNKGKFILKTEGNYLSNSALDQPWRWLEAFEVYFHEAFFYQLEVLKENLKKALADDSSALALLAPLFETFENENRSINSTLTSINQIQANIEPLIESYSQSAESQARKAVNGLYKMDANIFGELAKLLEEIASNSTDDDEEEQEDTDDEAEAIPPALKLTPQAAAKQLIQLFKTIARARFQGRSIGKQTKSGRVLEFLGDKAPGPETFKSIGKAAMVVSGLRGFLRAHRNYLTDVAKVYKRFRRDEDGWYESNPGNQHISAEELDAVIYLSLKNSRELLGISFVRRNLEEARFNLLSTIASQFKMQVFVDEATDFSGIQLACMQMLTNPTLKSFFACGDFNQRLTEQGLKTVNELEALPLRSEYRRITTVYRQSRVLNELSKQLLSLSGGDVSTAGELPEHYNHPGVEPVLLGGISDVDDIAKWLAQRIEEIEESVKVLPTIGILVTSDEDVEPLAVALTRALEHLNIEAEACLGGKSLG